MAEDPMDEGRQNPIPPPLADDHEDVSWALSTAQSTWDRGEHTDALKWLRRAVEAASEAEADDRALTLAKAAADLTTRIDELGWDSVRPPPGAPTITVPDSPHVAKPTVRLSPLVPPPPPAAPASTFSAAPIAPPPPPAPPMAQQAGRPHVPPAPPAPSPRAFRPSPPSPPSSPAATASPSAPMAAAGQRVGPSPRSTGSSLLGGGGGSGTSSTSAAGSIKPARPKHPSLGLLGPRPSPTENGGAALPRASQPTRPPLPPRPVSRPPGYREGAASAPPAPPPAPPPSRVDAPAVIEAISSKNLVSVSLPQTPSAEPFPLQTPAAAQAAVPAEVAGPSLSALPAPPPPPERARTTRPAGAWDDGPEDGAFAPTPVYPSGPESITFVGPSQIPPPLEDGPAAHASLQDIAEQTVVAPMPGAGDEHAPTAPPTSSPSLETTWGSHRNASFTSTEEMESWPTEAIPGHALPHFNVEDSTKTRVGMPSYREEAISASSQTHRLHDAESRIAARGPAQKPSQAVRVVVWRGPDGVHVAPHGTTVTAISVDALLVALDPSADLFAWLTNK